MQILRVIGDVFGVRLCHRDIFGLLFLPLVQAAQQAFRMQATFPASSLSSFARWVVSCFPRGFLRCPQPESRLCATGGRFLFRQCELDTILPAFYGRGRRRRSEFFLLRKIPPRSRNTQTALGSNAIAIACIDIHLYIFAAILLWVTRAITRTGAIVVGIRNVGAVSVDARKIFQKGIVIGSVDLLDLYAVFRPLDVER